MASDNNDMSHKKLNRFTPKKRDSSVEKSTFMRPSILLTGAGLIALAAAVGWLSLFTKTSDVRVSIKNIEVADDGATQLTGARYRGTTKTGKTYEITATNAIEENNGSGVIQMVEPTGFITQSDGGRINITALNGAFSKSDSLVDLKGMVVLKQTKQNVIMTTEALRANIDAGEMQSDLPVKVTSPDAHITGQNIRVTDHGNVMMFGGTSKLTLHNIKMTN
ncbi:LPS export ABC transporter periplasmic protein LptC [uncultured Candidatus Puniceispirillum sp.]|uniref:LPS export ABC transporter periplasmic protein LptC n=1 Tax=uncultured Candidatus Puniceispirillum sp. TaxID=1985115 RepID=UPI0032B1D9E7